MSKSSNHINNFNVIRLLAALEVMLYHGFTHYNLDFKYTEPLKKILLIIPGVPVFFFISGFLIFKSYESNSSNLKKYFKNRFLRIYPALWICFLFTLTLLAISNVIDFRNFSRGTFWTWILAQLTFFQSYKIPDVSDWGVGHPNGSLWSICVELQFYFFLPLIYLPFSKISSSKNAKTILTLILIVISLLYNIFIKTYFEPEEKLTQGLSLLLPYYFYFFGMGILFHLHFDFLKNWVSDNFHIWGSIYILYYLTFQMKFQLMDSVYDSNFIGVIGLIILAFATFSLAYSYKGLSARLIGENDISYGVYIYHMPIFNYFYQQQNNINVAKLMFFCLLTVMISYLSWIMIEKKALSRK